MAERRSAVAPSAPAPQAGRHRCICGGGCGLGLARLVGRLRRQGRRALCSSPPAAARRRRCQCQYDPLSYARNFDLGDAGDGDDAAAAVYYSYSFSSRFVLAPSSSSSSSAVAAAVSDPSGLGSRPVVTSH
ncbi:hypothetical protein PR202_gb06336 [Eleusine coracana subsp. coracana]|uniref:Uncharacterized protein n=1 Tax=Eleusine coracana subsp. coracana TaxID=191504 RepID=A0AAV5E8K2_ELECO|nr:hypothetical protein QOZ80_2BG0156300 [Eleusine coracana subsp. coracana]GJN19098.1 hypothetical protein PR202_gb06336 [Eleusine coracana subsp. coracana]